MSIVHIEINPLNKFKWIIPEIPHDFLNFSIRIIIWELLVMPNVTYMPQPFKLHKKTIGKV